MASFPFYKQHDAMDCGPTCLRMVAKHYGKNYSLQTLREKSSISREGVSLLGISDAAESIGMRTMGVSLNFDQLKKEAPLPVIVHWKQEHFVVVYKIRKNKIYVSDPAFGLVKYNYNEFKAGWLSTKSEGTEKGLALLLEPKPEFYLEEGEVLSRSSFGFLTKYIKPYKKFIWQLVLGVLIASMLQLIFPFLTQAIVDYGINNKDQSFIVLILIAQLILTLSRQSVEFIRGWILLHLSTRVNISLISDFLIKLMKLPISFFDSKQIGDLLQRIGDHKRIESFLTNSSLDILFSLFSLFIFGIVLGIYSIKILVLFLLGSVLYFMWVLFFMNKRRNLDNRKFIKQSENQGKLIQIINGIEEIKINNAERHQRWEWEEVQSSLFKINVKSLSLNQYQQAGAVLINEIKNILITFLAASAVVNGTMTLGMMLAVSYILGQLNAPIERMVFFIRATQDAKISLERLSEIHDNKEEEEISSQHSRILSLGNISVQNLNFSYESNNQREVLSDFNLEFPKGSVTAIVGVSGSGKTTLVKLLLAYYKIMKGEIRVGDQNLNTINPSEWRNKCGVVLQNGYLFSDTIANNIALGKDEIDMESLMNASKLANLNSFIENLPLGFNTKVGQEGQNISGGEKQRILIARAIYKNPEYLFIDEATSSLDANNEKLILENLKDFYKGKTVIIVAHRLSTVKDADQIVVLDKGKIVEKGTHSQLSALKGKYYELVKNQLELGA
ncbi:MAG: peptidase domain-containing ABC transporter [Bacteroidales bacterium]|nr:peptidase domain-containing ABC transporter [Bacteroidales bacterium]MCF8390412.1 peptidase domain-containing ABC transporter [Bacteroidales bacterium]